MKNLKYALLTLQLLISSCADWFDLDWELTDIPNNMEFENSLSSYNLFSGEMKNLIPAENAVEFKLNTELFTDYAEKQRLLLLPESSQMIVQGDGLPVFPEGTIIAKTFYYNLIEGNPESNKRILETRLLILNEGKWNVAVYEWNDVQSDAFLIHGGKDIDVVWLRSNNKLQRIKYHIPSHAECTTCHLDYGQVSPLGPKLNNLNKVNSATNGINQLEYLREKNLLTAFDISRISKLPEWDNTSYSINQRARAYLDVNCSHCHNPGGIANNKKLNLLYEVPLERTDIVKQRHNITERMKSNWADEKMPRLGTTILHEEAFELIKLYLKQF